MFWKKERSLGVARKKRRYDLGLNKGDGARFLLLLICLMTFLAALALAAAFALGAMTERWSSGLENKITIEIPAEGQEGTVRSPRDLQRLLQQSAEILKTYPAVTSLHILSTEEIGEMVEPWLGKDLALGRIPLPALIAVELDGSDQGVPQEIERKLQEELAANIRVDTHEKWLNDLMRFTGALKFASIMLGVIIGLTTIIAVAGAIKARIAVHEDEVELLHLMGASDRYIARQFQTYTLILALQGSLIGVFLGGIALMIIGWLSGEMDVNLLPDFRLRTEHLLALGSLPLITGLIATLTARQTVMKALAQMP